MSVRKLTLEQTLAVEEFIRRSGPEVFDVVPAAVKWLKPGDRNQALKFLRYRHWDIDRALAVLRGYVDVHEKLGDWSLDATRDFHNSGIALCDPRARDRFGRAIFWVFARNQRSHQIEDWQTRAKASFQLVEPLLELPEIQEAGFTVIFDLKGAHFSEKGARDFFDALQNKIPARFGAIFIVNPPWVFKFVYKVVSVFLKKKIRDRLKVLDTESILQNFIDPEFIPECLDGGKSKYSSQQWLAAKDKAISGEATVADSYSSVGLESESETTERSLYTSTASMSTLDLSISESDTASMSAREEPWTAKRNPHKHFHHYSKNSKEEDLAQSTDEKEDKREARELKEPKELKERKR